MFQRLHLRIQRLVNDGAHLELPRGPCPGDRCRWWGYGCRCRCHHSRAIWCCSHTPEPDPAEDLKTCQVNRSKVHWARWTHATLSRHQPSGPGDNGVPRLAGNKHNVSYEPWVTQLVVESIPHLCGHPCPIERLIQGRYQIELGFGGRNAGPSRRGTRPSALFLAVQAWLGWSAQLDSKDGECLRGFVR